MADQTKKQLTGLRRNQQFLYIGIFTLVAVVVWVAGSIFQSQKKTGISSELQKMAIPLNPNLSTLVIDRIESKVTYSPEELGEFEIYRLRIEDQNRARAGLPVETSSDDAAAPEEEATGSLGDVLDESSSSEDEIQPAASPAVDLNEEFDSELL